MSDDEAAPPSKSVTVELLSTVMRKVTIEPVDIVEG